MDGLSHTSSSATPFHYIVTPVHLKDDVRVDQERRRVASRPTSRDRSRSIPLSGAEPSSALSPPERGVAIFARRMARPVLSLGIDECCGNVPYERSVFFPDLDLNTHKALPLAAPGNGRRIGAGHEFPCIRISYGRDGAPAMSTLSTWSRPSGHNPADRDDGTVERRSMGERQLPARLRADCRDSVGARAGGQWQSRVSLQIREIP